MGTKRRPGRLAAFRAAATGLTDRAVAAVHAMHEAGIALALTSGRPPRGMQKLVEPLRLSTPVAGFNGGVLVNPDMSVIESRMLSPSAAHTALQTILDKGLDAWLYTPDAWLIRDRPHEATTQVRQALLAAGWQPPSTAPS